MDPRNLNVAATFLAAGASFVAAIFWGWAAVTKLPSFPDVGWDSDRTVFDPIAKSLRNSARRNAIAAAFSFVAATSALVAFLAQAKIDNIFHLPSF